MGNAARRLASLVFALAAIGEPSPSARTASGASAWVGPRLVSPGGRGREGQVGNGCPTFTWALNPDATAYRLVVYEVGESEGRHPPSPAPALRAELPAGATLWVPELGQCLAPGRYGWAVAALVETTPGVRDVRWSKPAVFRVVVQPGDRPRERPPETSTGASNVVPSAVPPSSSSPYGSPPRTVSARAAFTPPLCYAGLEMFEDVPASDLFCRWVEQLARDGIAKECGAGKFCPDLPVTHEQLALFLVKAFRGTAGFAPAPQVTSNSRTVDDPLNGNLVGGHSDIAIGDDGFPIISYLDSTTQDLKVAHCNDPVCAGMDETITTVDPSANNVGFYTSIAIGKIDNLPIISYYDAIAGALLVAHCNDTACAGQDETITVVDDTAPFVGSHTSIAIGNDNLPIISYVDESNGDLKVAHCNDVACAGENETINVVDPAAGADTTSLAIGDDGLPIISYHEFGDLDLFPNLKVAHCNDVACDGQNETLTTVDDPDGHGVGGASSIAIGGDDLPVISYFDDTADAVKVAHCNDPACEGQNETINTVEDLFPEEVGAFTAIAKGADGLPLVADVEIPGAALKLAHCNDVACAGQDESIITLDPSAGYSPSIAIGVTDQLAIISSADSSAGTLKVTHCETLTCAP